MIFDSTLCNTHHRHHLAHVEKPDWQQYSLQCANDEPVLAVVTLARALAQTHALIIVSARDGAARYLTCEWLRKNKLPVTYVALRASGSYPSFNDNDKVKVDLVRELQRNFDFKLFVDDWPPVKPVLEALGIPTLIVNPPSCGCSKVKQGTPAERDLCV